MVFTKRKRTYKRKKNTSKRRKRSTRPKTSYTRKRRTLRYRNKRRPTKFEACVFNPFSQYGLGAKIPDGKSVQAVGMRLQQRVEVRPNTGDGKLLMVFMPGLTNCVWMSGEQNGIKAIPFVNHGNFNASIDANTLVATNITQTGSGTINKWRTVSAGMTIKLVKSDNENDGWFEAIRFSHNSRTAPAVIEEIGEQGSNIIGPLPNASWLGVNTDWLECPTYVSGNLKDLHKCIFTLNSDTTDHDFVDLGNICNANGFVDGAMDCVAIRIFGRAFTLDANNPAANEGRQTRFLIHVASNQELMYDDGAVMNRFHTVNYSSPRAMEIAKVIVKQRQKAAIMLTK